MKESRIRILVEIETERRCRFRLPTPSFDQSPSPDIEPRHWFLKKLDRAYETAMRAIETADHGLLLQLKRLIHYLQSKISPDEAVMKHLRKADIVEIVYPPQYQEKWVRRHFRRFVRRQFHHHQRWLVINFLLLPITGLMTLVPGPNVFFGWNAFRLISHYLAREGGKRVRSGLCEIQFNPPSAIRHPQLI
jgi:hypothetical protein